MKTLALSLALWCVASTALAGSRSTSFELPCPDVTRCARGENGSWIPAWYGRELAKEAAHLEGVREELLKAQKEISALRLALAASKQESDALKLSVVAVQSTRKADRDALASAERRVTRRTRWALGATVVGILLAGALSAGIYVAGR